MGYLSQGAEGAEGAVLREGGQTRLPSACFMPRDGAHGFSPPQGPPCFPGLLRSFDRLRSARGESSGSRLSTLSLQKLALS